MGNGEMGAPAAAGCGSAAVTGAVDVSAHLGRRPEISRRSAGYSPMKSAVEFRGLPDFFVVGPPRTGTTWIHDVMKDRVNLPRVVKEPRFFDLRYSKGLDWYRKHFDPIVVGLPTGEVTPTYFYSVPARQRIYSLIPGAKIICTLRDPVRRLYSLYRLRCSSGTIRCSFRDAIANDPELIESNRYLFHLNGWIDSFGRDRVLVLIYEQLVRDPRRYMEKICRFVGIAPFDIDESMLARRASSDLLFTPTLGRLTHLAVKASMALNVNRYNRILAIVRKLQLRKWFLSDTPFSPPALDPQVAEELRRRMRPEVEVLEAVLKTDLSTWKPEASGASHTSYVSQSLPAQIG